MKSIGPCHEVVLGRAEDALDYVDYCAKRGDQLTFLEPGAGVEMTEEGVNSWFRSQVGSNAPEVDSVVSFRDAFQVHTDLLRAALGMSSRAVEAVRCLTDKSLFKTHPAVHPYVAAFVEISPDTGFQEFRSRVLDQLEYPLVLKPSNGFYSVGVIRVDADAQLRRAWTSVRRVCSVLGKSRGTSSIHAETFLDGMETMADGFVVDGVVHSVLHHVKLPELNGVPTFHETGCVTQPFDPAAHQDMDDILTAVVDGLGLNNSAFNAEFRYDAQGKLHLLEIGPRLSGGGASVQNLMRICTGLDAYAIQRDLGNVRHRRLGTGEAAGVDLTPTHHGYGLEYDFCAARNGYLTNSDELVSRLRAFELDKLLKYRADGDYVFAPPMNVETIMTAFFRCASTEAAEELLNQIIETCSIQTVDARP